MSTRVYAAAGNETPSRDGRHGGGVYRCGVDDGKWERLAGGLPAAARVRAVAVHPRDPRVIYAGTLTGPYRSVDGGDTWRPLVLPDGEWEVWSFLFHPQRPEVVYAGTGPPAVFRSDDGGDSWTRLPGFRERALPRDEEQAPGADAVRVVRRRIRRGRERDAELRQALLDAHFRTSSSTISARSSSAPETWSNASATGSVKRRGPMLPGFTNSTPSRVSMRGRCEWPDTTAWKPAAAGSRSSSATSCST